MAVTFVGDSNCGSGGALTGAAVFDFALAQI
jgi:hypothetical protein